MQAQGTRETILRPGQIVGERYRIDKLIADGGLSAVWAGEDPQSASSVAIKVIAQPFASSGETVALLRREALAASKVEHPNVARILDVIDHADAPGVVGVVMEWLDGESLGDYLARQGCLGLHETVALLLPAMHGVATANAHGVFHRDLKPGNIFLGRGSKQHPPTTKVLDFGMWTVVRRAFQMCSELELLFRLGTPAYMPPEAIQGSPSVDGRADVYGFGVLLFEVLTGNLPFAGEPGIPLLANILTHPPLKVREYRPDLPDAAEHIIDCALAKDAKDRFPDVQHLIRAIEDHLLLRPPSPLPGPRSSADPSRTSGLAPGKTQMLGSLPGSAQPPGEPVARARRTRLGRAATITKVIGSLAGPLLPWTDQAGAASKTRPKRLWHLPHRRSTFGAAVIFLALVTIWVTAPRSVDDDNASRGRSALSERDGPAAGLAIVLLPGSPSPPPTAYDAGQLADSGAADETAEAVRPDEARSLAGGDTSKLTILPHEAPPRETPRRPAKRIARPDSSAVRQRDDDASAPPRSPRAGQLLRSDF